ncbi:MAG: amidohydrolase, partial [Chitinophagaceae bacterium]
MLKRMLVLLAILPAMAGQAQDKPVAFKGALIYTAAGDSISNAVLVVQNGKILAVGGASTPIPSNATIVDLKGKVIMPGLVDSHSHLGGPEGGDGSAALNPDARAMDAVNPT